MFVMSVVSLIYNVNVIVIFVLFGYLTFCFVVESNVENNGNVLSVYVILLPWRGV